MRIFEPLTIGGMTLKNRIVMSTMGVGLGYTNKRVQDFYRERAQGGVGAIIIGAGIPDLFVSDEVWGKPGGLDTFLKRLRLLTAEVQEYGAKIGIQFIYGNRYPLGLDLTSGELVAPSARIQASPSSHAFVKPGESLRELTLEEIASIIDKIGRAAAGAKEAGFDFVELHNGHGMLHCQFFSPTTNRRNDRYGGDRQRRMNFGLDTVRAMRAAVGEDFPISVRHGAVDVVAGGATLEDGVAFAVELEKAGADLLNVSLATPPICGGYVPTGEDPVATHAGLAAAVKKKVGIPVVAVGRIKTPEVAEAILAEGKADLVALGRQLFADPHWPNKVAEGRTGEIVPCIDCHECYERATAGAGVECTVNYRAGREGSSGIEPAAVPGHVLVIGAGPAGMEAARVAALRGHQVTLKEKSNQLGGSMLLQAVVPSKGEVENLTRYLSGQVVAAGVGIELKTEADRYCLGNVIPDAVIVASGSIPVRPEIPGIDRENVVKSSDLHLVLSGEVRKKGVTVRAGWRGALVGLGGAVLNRPTTLELRKWLARVGIPIIFGKRVAILGGNLTACQLADLLSENGRSVTIVTPDQELATDMVSTLRFRLLNRLADRKVAIVKGIDRFERITDEGLVITRNGVEETVASDTVVPMLGFEPDDRLMMQFRGVVPEVVSVGDCADPLKLLHAVHDGARAGREVCRG